MSFPPLLYEKTISQYLHLTFKSVPFCHTKRSYRMYPRRRATHLSLLFSWRHRTRRGRLRGNSRSSGLPSPCRRRYTNRRTASDLRDSFRVKSARIRRTILYLRVSYISFPEVQYTSNRLEIRRRLCSSDTTRRGRCRENTWSFYVGINIRD